MTANPLTMAPVSIATDKIERHWNRQRLLRRCVGAKFEEMNAFERTYGVKLSGDFAHYIGRLNGITVPGDPHSWDGLDNEGFEFYPLSLIHPAQRSATHFVFCRWALGLLPFAICLSAGSRYGEIVSLRGELAEPHFVAPTFSDFVDLYVANSRRLYQCGARVSE